MPQRSTAFDIEEANLHNIIFSVLAHLHLLINIGTILLSKFDLHGGCVNRVAQHDVLSSLQSILDHTVFPSLCQTHIQMRSDDTRNILR